MTDAQLQSEVAPHSASVREHSRAAATWAVGHVAAGLRGLCGPRSHQAFGILMYHRITEPVADVPRATWNVTPAQLRGQLAGLLARGFRPRRLSQLLNPAADNAPASNTFAVTFDDGYANNLHAALPILRELKVPATIFLATSYLDSPRPFPFDDWAATGTPAVPQESWRPLTTAEAQELHSSDWIELGAHTHTHQRFVGRTDDFRQDMAQCLATLQEKFGIERPPFALPYGAGNPALVAAVRDAGVSCCLTTAARTVQASDDPFDWGRFDVDGRESAGALAAKLSGWYGSVATAGKALVRPLKTWRSRHQNRTALAR